MKKTLNFIILFFCLVASLNFRCDGDKVTPASCDNAISNYTAAVNAYHPDEAQ